MKHLEFEKLVKNFEGLLPLAEEQKISGHLRKCAECAALAAKLESFFDYVQKSGQNEQVSQADTARLLNIFKPPKVVSPPPSFGQRLLAGLVFDDWQTALGERFAAADSRNLLYRAGEFEIDLRLLFTGGKCLLSGQVFPACRQPASAEIFSGEVVREKVFLNDYCEFVFPPLKEGIYSFRFESGGNIIEIENLSLIN
jgi:hypothetical protein